MCLRSKKGASLTYVMHGRAIVSIILCTAFLFIGTVGTSDAAILVAFDKIYDIPAASEPSTSTLGTFVMQQFDPTLGTLESVDVTVSGDAVYYYGHNKTYVFDASAAVAAGVAVAGLSLGNLNRIYYAFPNLVNTLEGTFDAGQSKQVNTDALWGFPVLGWFIGNSTLDGGVGLIEGVGYQDGNSYSWFDGDQSFGETKISVRIEYVYTPAAAVPEPATMLLFGAGLAGVGFMRKRMKV